MLLDSGRLDNKPTQALNYPRSGVHKTRTIYRPTCKGLGETERAQHVQARQNNSGAHDYAYYD